MKMKYKIFHTFTSLLAVVLMASSCVEKGKLEFKNKPTINDNSNTKPDSSEKPENSNGASTPTPPASGTVNIFNFDISSPTPTKDTSVQLRYSLDSNYYSKYCILENSINVAACTWNNPPLPSTFTISATDGVKQLTLFLKDYQNIISSSAQSNSIIFDNSPPAVPASPFTVPASPDSSVTPFIKGIASGDTHQLYFYSDPTCSLMIGFGQRISFMSSGISLGVSPLSTTTVYTVAEDLAGNQSACTLMTSYQNVAPAGGGGSVAQGPLAFQLEITSPLITKNNLINIKLNASLQSANQYCILENDTNIGNCGWFSLPFPSSFNLSISDGAKVLSAFLKDPDGNISNRVDSVAVTLDTTPPATPSTVSSSPGSPGTTITPYVKGAVDADTHEVYVYDAPACSLPLSYGNSSQFAFSGLPVSVTPLSSTSLYVQAVDRAGNKSSCVLGTSYIHQNAALSPLSVGFLNLSTPSPSSMSNPNVIGYAGSDVVTVKTYKDSSCTLLIGTGTKAIFESAGITSTLDLNTTTIIYAQGEDVSSNKSSCSLMTSFVHDNLAPAAPAALNTATFLNSLSLAPVLSWSGGNVDAGSGFKEFQYSVGTTAGAIDIKAWTSTNLLNNLQASGLTLADGQSYFLNLRSIDNAGNISVVASSASWLVDVSPPSSLPTFVASNPTSPTNATLTPSIIGSASVDTTTVKIFSDSGCSVQVGTGSRTDFVGIGIIVSANANAATSLYARAYDHAGNYSPTCTFLTTFNHDNSAPALDAFAVLNNYYTNSTTFNLSWGASYGSPFQYCIKENNTTVAGCVWNNYPLPTSYTTSGTNGSIVLSAWVKDAAQNISTRTDGPSKVFDNISPAWAVPSLTYSATSTSTETSPVISYNRNATDANPNLIYQYALGTGTVGASINNINDWTTVVASSFTISGLSLTDGNSYYVHIRAYDAAGNLTIAVPGNSFTVNVPVNPPKFLAFNPLSPTSSTLTPLINGNASGNAVNIWFYSDSICSAVVGNGTAASFNAAGVSITVAANATSMIYARTSNAGNTKYSTCTYLNTFSHDNTPPVEVSSIDDGDYFSSTTTSPSIQWTAGGADAVSGFARYEYAIGSTYGGTNIRTWTSTGAVTSVSATGLALIDGNTYYASVRVIDNAGNISLVRNADGWIVDITLPVIGIIEPTENKLIQTNKRNFDGTCEIGQTVTITYGANTTGPSSVQCDALGTFVANVSFSGIEGNRAVTFTQIDSAFNSASTTRTISYEPTFNQLTDGFNAYVFDMVSTIGGANRGLFVGGNFTQYGDITVNRFIKLLDDGQIDPTFPTGAGFNSTVYSILPDNRVGHEGKVYVGGLFTDYDTSPGNDGYIVRLNPDGSLDTTFDPGVVAGAVRAITYAPDGSGDLYLGGEFTNYQGTAANRLVRITTSGARSVVTSFNTNASGTTNGPNGIVHTITAANDGTNDIYIGGAFTTVAGSTINRIARLQNDGTHHTTFRTNVITTSNGFNSDVRKIMVDQSNNGRIYVGGAFTTYKAVASAMIIRLTSAGVTDAANFAIGTGFTAASIVHDIEAVHGTSDIVVGGTFTTYKGSPASKIVQINSTGSINPVFNYRKGFDGTVYSLLMQSIVENPTLDLYVGGDFASFNSTGMPKMARLNNEGTLDNILEIGTGVSGYANDILPMQDKSERVYISGSFTTYNSISSPYIARVKRDGLIDSTFAVGTGFNAITRTMIPRVPRTGLTASELNQIYVAGDFITYKGVTSNRIIRLNSDGTLDSTFNVGTGFNAAVYKIIPTKDGSGDIYVSGFFDTYKGVSSKKIIRLKDNGDINYSFNAGAGFNNYVLTMLNAPDNTLDIYAGGYFTTYNGTVKNKIVRLQPNGTISSAFNPGTAFNTTASTGVWSMAIDPSTPEHIYVGGNFSSYQSFTTFAIARLKPTGSLDNTFVTGGGIGFMNSTPAYVVGTVYSISPSPDGSILIGGNFNRYNTSYTISPNIIRLTRYGTIDANFVVGTGVNALIYGIIDTGDGSGDYILAGDYTTYNGLLRNGVIRVQSDGNGN